MAKGGFNNARFDSLVAEMLRPAFYPKAPIALIHKETHISHLFLTDDLAYKIKKPVRFSFLDFSTLAKRRHYLQEELKLNRRLAPSVYLGVMPITFDRSGWRLGDGIEPVEYTLVMRRLPENRMMPFLLETQQVTPSMMADLAKLLAGFHRSAEILRQIDRKIYVASIEAQWNESLDELERYLPDAEERETFRGLKNFGRDFLARRGDLLARRGQEGWVRDVHGDLHAEHICFAPEGIQIFDCIEFDAKLRRCDLAAEIGFLSMDLRVRGGETLVEPFLSCYCQQMNDGDLTKLLRFFECYRALVRAKVHTLRSGNWNEEAARYIGFARRLTWDPMKPFIVIVCGLTGSGKSTLARALAERIGLTLINSDVVRKRIAGTSGRALQPLNEGIYSVTMTEKTYGTMAREAEEEIAKGKGALLDATFVRRAHREKILRLADKRKVPLLLIHCTTPELVIKERLRRRTAEGKNVSDGDWDIYVAQKVAAEPIEEIAADDRLELNTDSSLGELTRLCEAFLRSHWAH